MPAGRPKEYTDEIIATIVKKMEAYTEQTPIPILAEFAYQNNFPRQVLYEHPGFLDARKNLISKKEAALEREALNTDSKTNVTMAIFSLKQLGWSDKQERVLKTIDDEGNETGFKLVAPPEVN